MTQKAVVWTFGRMSPVTIGHEKLINTILHIAKTTKADTILFLSQTRDCVANPLSWEDKCNFARRAFNIPINDNKDIKTPFQALEFLCQHYKHITMVVGDDRADTFLKRMTPYATTWGAELFAVVNAGRRNSSSLIPHESSSSTTARQFAKADKFEEFSKIIASTLSVEDKLLLFNQVRSGLNIR